MPWKIQSAVGERLRLVKLAFKAQQPIAQLCRVFDISRPTAYKWMKRFEAGGRRALSNDSRRPHRSPRKIRSRWIKAIGRIRRRHRHWGPKKIRVVLGQQGVGKDRPAVRTIARYLKAAGLVRRPTRRSGRGPRVELAPLTMPKGPNEVWTVDFKGWFRTADGKRAEPLTVRDLFSRYGLAVRLVPDQSWRHVRVVFLGLFRRYGQPRIIRMDNGGPFASKGPARLSRLSVWWTALGIRAEFTDPGHPEQNGAHEQFHRLLKTETTRPVSSNRRSQQRRINRWLGIYNDQRPHEALGQRPPAEFYKADRKRKEGCVARLTYPRDWSVRRVRSNGQIRWQGRLRFIGEAFVGYRVGLKNGISAQEQEVYLGGVLLGVLCCSDPGGLRPAAYARPGPSNRGIAKV